MSRENRQRLEALAEGAGTAMTTAEHAAADRTRCKHKPEPLRWGNNVAMTGSRCKRLAALGEEYCWQHGNS